MKKIALLFLATALLAFKSADTTWTADPAHSKLGFTVTHLMVTDVDGSFKTFSATINASKEDLSDAVVDLSADVASVTTDNEGRDKHIKSDAFFDAEKFPKLTFKSTSVKKTGDKTYKVVGNLTLHGVTKSVSLDATMKGPVVNPMSKKTTAGFKVTGTINRKDFGIGSGFGNAMVSEDVTLNANCEFTK